MSGKSVFPWFSLFVTLSMLACSKPSAPPQEPKGVSSVQQIPSTAQPGGNNSEAAEFAEAMTGIARQTWPKAEIVWNLKLTPQQISGNILQYRKNVTHCNAMISASDEWLRQTETSQRTFLKSSLDTLHKSTALPANTLDYYPNSSGEVLVQVKDRVVARGTYTRTKTDVRIEPGTSVGDKLASHQFVASVSIVKAGSAIRFQGTTNVSDGESILVTLKGHGYQGQTKVMVSGGRFITEGFSNRGRELSSGAYSLQFNVYDPKTGLKIEAKRAITLSDTNTVVMTFKPVQFGE